MDKGFETLPHQYVQPLEDRFDTTTKTTQQSSSSIPIIDVANWDDPEVAEAICEAAIKWGFFQIVNHGIPMEILNQVKDAGRRFFESPIEEKKKYLRMNSPSETICLNTSFNPDRSQILNLTQKTNN